MLSHLPSYWLGFFLANPLFSTACNATHSVKGTPLCPGCGTLLLLPGRARTRSLGVLVALCSVPRPLLYCEYLEAHVVWTVFFSYPEHSAQYWTNARCSRHVCRTKLVSAWHPFVDSWMTRWVESLINWGISFRLSIKIAWLIKVKWIPSQIQNHQRDHFPSVSYLVLTLGYFSFFSSVRLF